MSQPELLKLVAERLKAAGIEYMVSGSIASSLQGEPRSTHDLDIVIAVRIPATDAAARLKAAFPEPDFYLDEAAVREAILARAMFNLVDTRDADKVDFWLLTEDLSTASASGEATSNHSRASACRCRGPKTPS